MAIYTKHLETEFGVGDKIRLTQKIEESGKERMAVFEGMVISLKGFGNGRTVTIRRIGEAAIGIERIFPLASPTVVSIEVVKKGTSGVKHAKLYYTRTKSPREIEKIYARAARKGIIAAPKKKKSAKRKK